MGCAISGPTNAIADSIKGIAQKEEKSLQEFGTATKDTIMSGVGQVNEVVGTALKSIENEVSSVTAKATNFFGNTEEHAADTLRNEVDQVESNISENVNEAISDAETIIMSQNGHDQNDTDVGALTEIDDKNHMEMKTNDESLKITEDLDIIDMEQNDYLGENIENVKSGVEKLIDVSSSNNKEASSKDEPKKEELGEAN